MRDLTQGHEGKIILRFALPMVLANMLQQSSSIIDGIIVGNVLGKDALAAVGASFPVIYALISFAIGIGSGATVVISQYFGAKKFEQVKLAVSTIFIYLFVTGILLSVLSIVFSTQIFQFLKVEAHVLPIATRYFDIYMFGIIGFFGFNAISSSLRGMGDSLTPLYFMVIVTICNVILDVLFVMVFKWGIDGVAWAAVISHLVPFVVGAYYLTRKHAIISFRWSQLKFDRAIFISILKVGLPTAFQQIFIALGMTALIRIVNNFETSVLAAYTIASRIDALAGMPALTLSSALSAFVGQNIGANRMYRIKKGYLFTLYMAWTISAIVSGVVYFFGPQMISIFNQDPQVVFYGSQYLITVSWFYLIFSTMFVVHGVLRGAGDTLIPMFISIISLWLVRIPFAVYLSDKYGVIGIWWAIPIGWTIGFLLSQIYFFTGRWKRKGIIHNTNIEVVTT